MSTKMQSTKRTRSEYGDAVTPELPLEMWNLIVDVLLSERGMAWIKSIHLLLLTNKMFNQILCDLASDYVEDWRRGTNECLISMGGNWPFYIMPSNLDRQKGLERQGHFEKRLSKKWLSGGYENDGYTVAFKFEEGKEYLSYYSLYKTAKSLRDSAANERMILYFTPGFLNDLKKRFEAESERLREHLAMLCHNDFENDDYESSREEYQKFVQRKAKLKHQIRLLELFLE